MSVLEKLREAESIHDLAIILGFTPSSLAYVLYKKPDVEKYTNFEIAKSGGGKRKIDAPIGPLKTVQRRLANVLYTCRQEIERESPRKSLSHAFRKDHSIVTNASCHKRRRYVLNLDLREFFPSINFGRVRGFFIKNREFELNEKVATIIAQISCFQNSLPQGSPCSPIISDLVAHLLDVRLVQLAKRSKTHYSRYADDITFSTNQRIFPESLATEDEAVEGYWQLADGLVSRIEQSGYEVNNSKTRMQLRTSRQTVTGLTVNAKVNIRSDYYRRVRSMCNSLFSTGSYYRKTTSSEVGNNGSDEQPPVLISDLAPLEGMLSHTYFVKNTSDRRSEADKKAAPSAIRSLYRHFLRFRYFVVLKRPLIICEGKTDSIYIRSAIRSLAGSHPTLGSSTQDGFGQKVSFFNYETQASNLLNVKGGSGDLKLLISDYENILAKFDYKSIEHPVIILIDNDDGAKQIFSLFKEKLSISATFQSAEPWYHLVGNLYLVKTPSVEGKEKTCIEDFFDQATLDTKVKGKTFNAEKKLESKTEYGKIVFAEKVVRPNAVQLDLSGFSPLLDRISGAIANFQSQKE